MSKNNYDVDSIKSLKYPENVQQRPQMYIGPTDNNGLLTCIREIINNSVDEHLAGYCTEIIIDVNSEEYLFKVKDNGRGVPFEKVLEKGKKPIMETIFGELHAGRNFVKKEVYSTGINGVGSSCVNALSEEFIAISERDGKKAHIIFNEGRKVKYEVSDNNSKKSGTTIIATLNKKWFYEDAIIDMMEVFKLAIGIKATCPELKIIVNDLEIEHDISKLVEDSSIFYHKDDKIKPITNVITFDQKRLDDTTIQVAFQYDNRMQGSSIISYCNTIQTSEDGSHVTGFKRALSTKLTNYINSNKLSKDTIQSDDVYHGLNAVVSVFTLEPKYSSQTKQKLTNNEVQGNVVTYMNEQLDLWLSGNPKEVKLIADKIALSAKARVAQKRALDNVKKDNNTTFASSSIITKFSDCLSNNPDEAELFIVEGDSANGTVGVARNKYFQAVYRLKGKPLNVHGKDSTTARNNKEIDDLFQLLKCGTGKNFDISKLKFGKIIFTADSDVDGAHIQMLLLTIFGEYFKPLIEAGRIYIAKPPLYRVTRNNQAPMYLLNDKELDKFMVDETKKLVSVSNPKYSVEKAYFDLKKYSTMIEEYSDTYSINIKTLEFLLYIIRMEILDDIKFNDEKGTFTINRFVGNGNEEYFLSINNAPIELFEKLNELNELIDIIIEGKIHFINDEETLFDKLKSVYEIRKHIDEKFKKSITILRMKGLGESDADDLELTTINPATRSIIQVTSDGLDDMEILMNSFMGNDVGFRKEFLFENIKDVNLNDLD